MNGARLILSFLLVAIPAVSLPAVRRTRRPQAWAFALALSLGAGFVLLEASLIHAALPLGFELMGLDALARACRAMGGHLFGDPAPFSVFAGLLALVIGVQGVRGAAHAVRTNSRIRRNAEANSSWPVGGHRAVVLPIQSSWALAIPGSTPQVVLSSSLVGALEMRELEAVVHHEMAHVDHHHIRFLLLGTVVYSGLWFLPWADKGVMALKLALERWADESASAGSRDARAFVRSAVSKLASVAPSVLADDRIRALDVQPGEGREREWGWSTVVSATVPLVLALAVTLAAHLAQVISMAGAG